jgi:CheY-like chemotaxis protein
MKHKPTVLVADDDRHLRRAVGARLTALGYRVVEAVNGLTALTQYLAQPIDAVILDHGMPAGDGRSIAWAIRNESDVPIIFLSGYDREQFQEIVMQLPDVYYLSKPLDERKLAQLLAALLRPKPALLWPAP